MGDRLRLLALRTYAALPVPLRKFLVRRISPSFRIGVACIVERDDGAVLLVRHSYRGGWGLPGGLIGRGEEPDAAARREAREEVGVDVELRGEPQVVIDPAEQRVDVVFPARIAPDSATTEPVACPPEIVEVRWFDRAHLPVLQEEAEGALRPRLHRGRPDQRRAGSPSASGDTAG